MFYVYTHRKATTNEVYYVGKGHAKRAWTFSRRGKAWTSAHAEHGTIVEILADNLTEKAAFALEVVTIAAHRSNGVVLANATAGGEGPTGYVASKEMCAANEARAKARFSTVAGRAELALSHVEAKNAGRDIVCVDTGEVFSCIPYAADRLGVSVRNLWRHLHHKTCDVGGWHLKFKGDPDPIGKNMTDKDWDREIARRRMSTQKMRPFVCVQNGCTYTSCPQAARALGISMQTIRKYLRSEQKTAQGYMFYRVGECTTVCGIPVQHSFTTPTDSAPTNARPFICAQTKKVYDSPVQAAMELDMPQIGIQLCLKGRHDNAMGYVFYYADKAPPTNAAWGRDRVIQESEAKAHAQKKGMAIVCEQTGKTYSSCTAAAKDTGCNKHNISACLTAPEVNKSTRGYSFRYAGAEPTAIATNGIGGGAAAHRDKVALTMGGRPFRHVPTGRTYIRIAEFMSVAQCSRHVVLTMLRKQDTIQYITKKDCLSLWPQYTAQLSHVIM